MGGACFTSCGRDKWPQLGGWAVGVHVNASGPFSPASLTWMAVGWVAEKNCICLAKLHFDRVCVIYSFGHRARCAIDVCRSDMAHRLWHVHRVAASPWRPSETPGERNAHPLTRPKRGSVDHNSLFRGFLLPSRGGPTLQEELVGRSDQRRGGCTPSGEADVRLSRVGGPAQRQGGPRRY